MSKNVLVMGTYSAAGVDSFDWWQKLPNVSDYDTVILDTTKIFNFWSLAGRGSHVRKNTYLLSDVNETDERIRSNTRLVKRKLLEILEFPVSIYALYHPDIRVCKDPAYQDFPLGSKFMSTNDWCPISIDTFAEKGRRIYVEDESYEEYFRDFKGWEYYFVPDSQQIDGLEKYYHQRWKVISILNVIATNKVDKPIAIEFSFNFHSWAHDADEKEGGYYSDPEKYGGSLILLPVVDRYNTEPLIEIVLQRGKVLEETPAPKWVSTIVIPGETSLQSKIKTEKQNLKTIESKVKDFESSLTELQKHKGLLYETGLTLQEIVKSALEKLGAKIKPSIVTDEFIIEVNGKGVLIEVKGNTKSITKDDVAQLVTDQMEHLKTTGQEIDGILVGNGWRLKPLDKRDVGNQLIFSKDAKRVAENHNIGLISTTELFKAYCETLKDPTARQQILDKMISSKGVIKL